MLVIDDEVLVRDVARACFEEFGYEVMTANNGPDGLELFRRHASEIRAAFIQKPYSPSELLEKVRAITHS